MTRSDVQTGDGSDCEEPIGIAMGQLFVESIAVNVQTIFMKLDIMPQIGAQDLLRLVMMN